MNADDATGGGAEFVVAPAELAATARAVKSLLGNISSGFSALNSDVSTLLDTWIGPAGSDFADGWKEIRGGVKDLLDSIAAMESNLNSVAQAYLAREGVSAEAITATEKVLDL
ncbi:WXG100 family type VII secretion target [Nocardia sp. NPDC003482]